MKKFLIKVNGNQYEVEVEEVRDDGSVVQMPVMQAVASAPSAPSAPAAAPKAAPAPAPKMNAAVPAGAQTITAPMPGTILKVNVASGDVVKKGQVLVVLEAMKMENEIVAPAGGTIATVNVSKGSSVNAGDVMVSMS